MNSLKGVQSIFDYVAFETKNKQGLATHGSIGLLEFLHMTCELVISRTLKKLVLNTLGRLITQLMYSVFKLLSL
jgi:hypothetical protein